MSEALSYHRGASRRAARLWVHDENGGLIDFSAGYSFEVWIGRSGQPAVKKISTGIAGAAGAGVKPSGTPNVTITWDAADLDIPPGSYDLELRATKAGHLELYAGSIEIKQVMS